MVTLKSGVITSEAGWRGDGSPQRYGMQHTMQTRARDEKSTVSEYSFNAKVTPNDTWAFNFDIQYVDSTMEIEDVSVMGATRAVVGLDLSGSGLPGVSIYHPGYDGGTENASSSIADPSANFWRSAMDHVSDNEGDELANSIRCRIYIR